MAAVAGAGVPTANGAIATIRARTKVGAAWCLGGFGKCSSRAGSLGRWVAWLRAGARWTASAYQSGAIWAASQVDGSTRGRISSARPPRTATSAGIGCDRNSGIDSVNP